MPKETAPAGIAAGIGALFPPPSIAVVGASANPDTPGYDYLHSLQTFGYAGEIYPVHPRAREIRGLPAYPSLREAPEPVDYVISCIPASAVLDLVDDCAAKGARALQLFTARFSEPGRAEGAALERRLAERARAAGVRIIGPNCMGLLYAAQGISFRADMPRRPGKIGLLSQSGNLLFELTYFGEPRGLRFSKAVSYGNGIDLNESDFLEYFAADNETAVVGAYVEGVRDGRRFLAALKPAGWLTNPVDQSILAGSGVGGTSVLEWMDQSPGIDLLLANVGEAWALGRPNAEALMSRIPGRFAEIGKRTRKPLAAVIGPSDYSDERPWRGGAAGRGEAGGAGVGGVSRA